MHPDFVRRTKWGNAFRVVLPWIIPAILIKLIVLPDWDAIGYYLIPDDLYSVYWNAEHVKQAIVAGENLYYSHSILAPEGVGLWGHTYTLIIGLFDWLFNDVVMAINATVYLHLVAFSAGVYHLCSIWLRSPWFRMAVALIVVFNSYVLSKSGIHLNLLLLGWIPWNLGLFLRSFNEHAHLVKPRQLLLSLLLLGVNMAFDYYAIIYTLSFVFLWFFYQRLVKNRTFKGGIKNFVWITVVLMVFHIISRLLFLTGMDKMGGIWDAPDIRAFFTPGSLGRWLHSEQIFPKSPVTENFVFAGYSLLLCLSVSIYYYFNQKNAIRGAGFWLFLLLCYWCIVFPVIKWDGRNIFYFPNSLMHYIPGVNQLRAPGRMIIMFFMASSVFIFFVAENIPSKRSWMRPLLAVLFVFFFFAEHATRNKIYANTNQLSPTQADYTYLSNKTILTLPFGVRDGLRAVGDYQVTDLSLISVPGAKLCSGYISRIPEKTWAQLAEKSWFNHTLKMGDSVDYSDSLPFKWAGAVHHSGIGVVRVPEKLALVNRKIRQGVVLLERDFRWKPYTEKGIVYLVR
jgi:hypothetical protein